MWDTKFTGWAIPNQRQVSYNQESSDNAGINICSFKFYRAVLLLTYLLIIKVGKPWLQLCYCVIKLDEMAS